MVIQKEIFSTSPRKRLVSYCFCHVSVVNVVCCTCVNVYREFGKTIIQFHNNRSKSYAAADTARTMKMNGCKDTVDYIDASMIRDDDLIQNTPLQQIDQLNVGNVRKDIIVVLFVRADFFMIQCQLLCLLCALYIHDI